MIGQSLSRCFWQSRNKMCDPVDPFDDGDDDAFPFIAETDDVEFPTWAGKYEQAFGLSDD